MICANCDRPFKDGDEVTKEQPGQIVGDRGFLPTGEESIVHYSCDDED